MSRTRSLVGPEARAAGATDLQSELEFLDAVLGLAALAVDPLVEATRRAGQVGDDEARIVLGFVPRLADDLGLVDHAPLTFPGLSRVTRLAIDVLGASGVFGEHARDDHVELGQALQDRVLGHRDHVAHTDFVEPLEQLGSGEPAIEPHQNARLGEAFLKPADDALEQRQRALLGGRIAGAQQAAHRYWSGSRLKVRNATSGR